MAIANPTHELENLEVARDVEACLTPSTLATLFDAFYSPESNVRRINMPAFAAVLRHIVIAPTTPSVVVERMCEARLERWFHALDHDANGWVEWAHLEAALSLAASMRKYPPEYAKPNKLSAAAVHYPGGNKAIWIPSWKRGVVCLQSPTPRVFAYPTGAPVVHLEGHQSCVTNAVFLEVPRVLLTFGCDRNVLVWDHRKPAPIKTLQFQTPATAACFDKGRKWFWIATCDGFMRVYDATLDQQVLTTVDKHADWIQDMLFLEELNTVVTASLDRTIGFWDSNGTLSSKKIGHTRGVYRLAYSSQSRMLFSSGQGKEICVWNPSSLDSAPVHMLQGHEKEIVALIADVCCRSLLSADVSGRIVVWDAQRFTKTQVLELSPLLLDASPVFAVTQAPITRELILFTAVHTYHLGSTLAASRVPRLGHRVRHFAAAVQARVFVVAFSQALHIFDMIDGTLLRALERPYGPTARIQCIAVVEALHLLVVQLDSGRVFTHRLHATRPLPLAGLLPTPLLLRTPSSSASALTASATSNEDAGIGGVWVSLQVCPHTATNRVLHRLSVVQRNGVCWTQFSALDDVSGGLIACAKPAGATCSVVPVRASHGGGAPLARGGSDAVVSSAAHAPSGDEVVLVMESGEVFVWSLVNNCCTKLVEHQVGSTVSTRVVGSLFLPQRNALLLLRGDGFSILNVGSYTALMDVAYQGFPELTDLVTKEDTHAASLLSPEANAFSLTRALAVRSDGSEALCFLTDYVGRCIMVDLEKCFLRFFASQSASIAATTNNASDDNGPVTSTSMAVASMDGISSGITKYFKVVHPNRSHSATATIHSALDRRTKEPVVMKCFTDRSRFLAEVKQRKALDDDPHAAPWIVRTVSVDNDAVASLNTSAREHEDDGDRLLPAATQSHGIRVLGTIVMESGEAHLQTWMPQMPIVDSATTTPIPSAVLGADCERRRSLQSAEEIDFALACLAHIVEALSTHGVVSMDLRPRSFVKVGDLWKLCSVDSIAGIGDVYAEPIAVPFCPPEMSAFMADKLGLGSGSVTSWLNPSGGGKFTTASGSPVTAGRCDPSMSMWTIAVVAYELQQGMRLLADTPSQIARGPSALPQRRASSAMGQLAGGGGNSDGNGPSAQWERFFGMTEEWLQQRREAVPADTTAGIIVRQCLFLEPKRRSTPEALVGLLKDCGRHVDVDSVFSRPSCFRHAVENALPRKLAPSVVPIEATTTDMGQRELTLSGCAVIAHAVPLPLVNGFACCDTDPSKSNEGVLHLYSAVSGAHLGFLPPPEFGDGDAGAWRWPVAEDLQARAELHKARALLADEGAGGPAAPSDAVDATATDNSSARSSPTRRRLGGTSCSIQLQPPTGWQQMELPDLIGTLEEERQVLHGKRGVDAVMEQFMVAMARKAPFYRGGQIEGDPMPLYAPSLARVGGPKPTTDASGAEHPQPVAEAVATNPLFARRKWTKYWANVKETLGAEVGGVRATQHRAMTTALDASFLRSVPNVSGGGITPDASLMSDPGPEVQRSNTALAASTKPWSKSQGMSRAVTEDALRSHHRKQKISAQMRSACTFSDNNLSSLDFHIRSGTQARLTGRKPDAQESHGVDEMQLVERDLALVQARSIQRERARREKLARRGLQPLAPPAVTLAGDAPEPGA